MRGLTSRRAKQKIDEELLKDWFRQLCRALLYLERKKIVHRDLKLANILIEKGTLKLGASGRVSEEVGSPGRGLWHLQADDQPVCEDSCGRHAALHGTGATFQECV